MLNRHTTGEIMTIKQNISRNSTQIMPTPPGIFVLASSVVSPVHQQSPEVVPSIGGL